MPSPQARSEAEGLAELPNEIRVHTGLELKRDKAAVEFLVVDSAETKPVVN